MARRILAALAGAGLLAALAWALLSLPQPAGLTRASMDRLPESGVTNPVTAVLLNYRGYDTLLEVAVLLLAVAGVWSMRAADPAPGESRERPLLLSLVRVVAPVLVVAAGYLLWIGAFAPGGAFQGGALLGGGLVLLILAGRGRDWLRRVGLLRWGLAIGLLNFALVSAVTMALTGGLLQFTPGDGGLWILAIESAAMISIGLTLGLLFLAGRLEETNSTRMGDRHD